MNQVSPEVNFYSREDTLLKKRTDLDNAKPLTLSFSAVETEKELDDTTDGTTIVRGIDHAKIRENDPNFIGPRNATDAGRPLLIRKIEGLTEVAASDITEYGNEYINALNATQLAMAQGVLQLNVDFPGMNADKQAKEFVRTVVKSSDRPYDEVLADLKAERERMRVALGGPDKELQLELNAAKELMRKQAERILAVRAKLVDRGASDEFMEEFDYTTKLMTKPDQEAYEHKMELTPEDEVAPLVNTEEIKTHGNFLKIIAKNFGKEGLRKVGILAPVSGQVEVITQTERA